MSSLNLNLNYFDHQKAMRIESRLGNGADVLPIRLWAYIGRQNPEHGRVAMLEAEIERVCRWWGEKGAMVAAMVEIGFLERDGEFFKVHDWHDHSGHLATFKKRAVKAARKRWGLNRKSSNASSNARSRPKQSPSSTLHSSAVHSSSLQTTTDSAFANPYQKPDREKELPRFLVYAYKVAKGFQKEDRAWDKANWSRFAKPAKEMADLFGHWKLAVDCIEALAKGFDAKGLDWTLETIAKHAHEWKLKREKGAQRHDPIGIPRVLNAHVGRSGQEQNTKDGGFVSAGEVLAGSRTMSDFLPKTEGGGVAPGISDGTDA